MWTITGAHSDGPVYGWPAGSAKEASTSTHALIMEARGMSSVRACVVSVPGEEEGKSGAKQRCNFLGKISCNKDSDDNATQKAAPQARFAWQAWYFLYHHRGRRKLRDEVGLMWRRSLTWQAFQHLGQLGDEVGLMWRRVGQSRISGMRLFTKSWICIA